MPPNCVNICTAEETSRTFDMYHNNGSDKCKRGRDVLCVVPIKVKKVSIFNIQTKNYIFYS